MQSIEYIYNYVFLKYTVMSLIINLNDALIHI